MAPTGADQFAADVAEATLQLAAAVGRILAHGQTVRTNLSRNAGGMGRPVSNNASKCALAAS